MSKRWVIPDIHGCFNTLRALVENQIAPSKQDTLFFLGDYIDRGKHSRQVLDYLRELQTAGYQLHCLKGNHEEVLLRCHALKDQTTGIGFYTLHDSWLHFGGRATLKSFGVSKAKDIPIEYIHFLANMPYYLSEPDVVMVHAGLNCLISNPFSDNLAMLWAKSYPFNPATIQHRQLLHGHTPLALTQIQQSLEQAHPRIGLDNGCVFHTETGLGNLLAWELNTQTLIVQPNIEPVGY